MKKLLILALLLAGCSGNNYTELPGYKYFDAPDCKGYGAVNYWWTLDPEDVIEAVAKNGVDVYHIEFFGWADSRRPLGVLAPIYRDYLAECRKRNVVLFVSVFNDNSHTSKYGNTPWRPPLGDLLAALDVIISAGPEGQIIQPVGETQTSLGNQFEREARNRLSAAGFKTCYNHGSRPEAPPAGWDYAAYHPNRTSSRIPARAVCVTDTGTILNELGGFARFDPAKVAAYAEKVLKTWKRPLVLYGFQHRALDTASLEAIGGVE